MIYPLGLFQKNNAHLYISHAKCDQDSRMHHLGRTTSLRGLNIAKQYGNLQGFDRIDFFQKCVTPTISMYIKGYWCD